MPAWPLQHGKTAPHSTRPQLPPAFAGFRRLSPAFAGLRRLAPACAAWDAPTALLAQRRDSNPGHSGSCARRQPTGLFADVDAARAAKSSLIHAAYLTLPYLTLPYLEALDQIDERRRMVALDLQCSRGMHGVQPGTLRLVARPLPVRGCHFHRRRLPQISLRRGRLRMAGKASEPL